MSEDTVKLMGYNAKLGSVSGTIFDSSHQYPTRYKDSKYTGLTDQKEGGSGKGWCRGRGHTTAKEPENHLLFAPDGTRCAKWRKGFKKKKKQVKKA